MASDIAIQAEEILKLRSRLNGIFAHHTGKSIPDIEAAMERDNFMDPTAAIEFGLVDAIIEKRQMAA